MFGRCWSLSIEEGLVSALEGIITVRIFNTNMNKLIIAEVPVMNGKVVYKREFEISGVPGKGAVQRIWCNNPVGSASGNLLPTGNPTNPIILRGKFINVSLVDAANPVVFVSAKDIGLTGGESPYRNK